MTADKSVNPISGSKRFIILDALRGIALLGICMANLPEFSLYTFLSTMDAENLPTAAVDKMVKGWLYLFIDGKFYTIFSILFGIGFSIIINNAAQKGRSGFIIFYRRMTVLLIIGFAHLMLLWSGDILMLYAVVGMTLPLFLKCKDSTILLWSLFFLLLPVGIDFICEAIHFDPAGKIVELQWILCDKYGITEENFAYFLRDAKSYDEVLKFLVMGSVERMSEFVDSNRYFKVLGLFLIGLYIGRHRFYADLWDIRSKLTLIMGVGLIIGLPLSGLYAWSAVEGHPLGLGIHSLIYFASVYLTSFGYIATFCLFYLWMKDLFIWKMLAYTGRMALTNYIGQSALGILLFYGVGMGLGATTGLVYVEVMAICIFLIEILWSRLWLGSFRFGPLEWVWRCLTYGKWFRILKDNQPESQRN